MGICTNELVPNVELHDGFTFKVIVETGRGRRARLNVECLGPDSDDIHNSQGVDLTATECRALAKMLMATADLIEE